ncbi:Pantothenate kinase type III, CoaX-like [Marinobacterium lacunae]|uniref:Type III pantothenate kinase n=1 Tax=Marinobacterium lacunae TaxID=1232683 RepID=A0A081FY35_9GAMM|nr:type III pantothenate kinase [Marinobacterium lacunae]KEA63440.1 Pantothenate kinase type III, CoaX-like [Marinobacterium lacunae]
MILEIDVGNTFLKWRITASCGALVSSGRVGSRDAFDTLALEWVGPIETVRVGSVASDDVNSRLNALIESAGLPKPLFAAAARSAAGVLNSYSNPEAMGVDRWLAMLAAWRRVGGACCVVDCGSAITIDYLSGAGHHVGGYILPGMRLLQQALLGNTARVFVDRPVSAFDSSPGCNTSDAVTHGADFLFEAIQLRVRHSLPSGAQLLVTGGDGELFQHLMGEGEWVPDLVLDGLVLAVGE